MIWVARCRPTVFLFWNQFVLAVALPRSELLHATSHRRHVSDDGDVVALFLIALKLFNCLSL
jgi:hypothetical protein